MSTPSSFKTTPCPIAVTPVSPDPSPLNVPVATPTILTSPSISKADLGAVVPMPTYLEVWIPASPALLQVPPAPALVFKLEPSPKAS